MLLCKMFSCFFYWCILVFTYVFSIENGTKPKNVLILNRRLKKVVLLKDKLIRDYFIHLIIRHNNYLLQRYDVDHICIDYTQ